MLDMNDSLIALSNAIDWKIFENEFAGFYSKDGSPAKPIRLMVGLLTQLSHIVNHKFLYKKASLNPINRHFLI